MNWQDIRQQYPNRWVVIEALQAHTKGTQRIIDSLALVGAFDADFDPAWECYRCVHAADPYREYYPVHTGRTTLEIGVLDAFGRVLSD